MGWDLEGRRPGQLKYNLVTIPTRLWHPLRAGLALPVAYPSPGQVGALFSASAGWEPCLFHSEVAPSDTALSSYNSVNTPLRWQGSQAPGSVPSVPTFPGGSFRPWVAGHARGRPWVSAHARRELSAQRGSFPGKGNLPPGPAPEPQSSLPVPSPTPVIRNNWNTALGCQPVRNILNEIKTRALCLLLFLAAAGCCDAHLRGCRSAWRLPSEALRVSACAPGDAAEYFTPEVALFPGGGMCRACVCRRGADRKPGRREVDGASRRGRPGKGPCGRSPSCPA